MSASSAAPFAIVWASCDRGDWNRGPAGQASLDDHLDQAWKISEAAREHLERRGHRHHVALMRMVRGGMPTVETIAGREVA